MCCLRKVAQLLSGSGRNGLGVDLFSPFQRCSDAGLERGQATPAVLGPQFGACRTEGLDLLWTRPLVEARMCGRVGGIPEAEEGVGGHGRIGEDPVDNLELADRAVPVLVEPALRLHQGGLERLHH